MERPQEILDAEQQLAATFNMLTGARPQVTIIARDEQQRVVVAVAYRGNELVKGMQIEAFVVERGDSIHHRSQLKDGNTTLVYRIESKRFK